MSQQDDVAAYIASAGTVNARFEQPGDVVAGVIVGSSLVPATDYRSGEVLRDAQGAVQRLLQVDVRTGEGLRAVKMKGSQPGSLLPELREALLKVGLSGPVPGDSLRVTYTGQADPVGTYVPRKLYRVEYRRAEGAVGADAVSAVVPF